MTGDRQIPQDLFNLREDFDAFRLTVIARLELLEERLPDEYRHESARLKRIFEIDEFRAQRGD